MFTCNPWEGSLNTERKSMNESLMVTPGKWVTLSKYLEKQNWPQPFLSRSNRIKWETLVTVMSPLQAHICICSWIPANCGTDIFTPSWSCTSEQTKDKIHTIHNHTPTNAISTTYLCSHMWTYKNLFTSHVPQMLHSWNDAYATCQMASLSFQHGCFTPEESAESATAITIQKTHTHTHAHVYVYVNMCAMLICVQPWVANLISLVYFF